MNRQPDFDLLNIRPHRGSRNLGFEELCSQLLSLEPRSPGSAFYRKGGSSDRGVEAYVELPSGKQHGLQAKFYKQFTADLASKLTASLNEALDHHENLVKYIVCLPFNLRDGQQGSGVTELGRWKAWKKRSESEAAQRSREVSIELWDASEIHSKLSSSDGRYAGRLKYWLDTSIFAEQWFIARWQEAKAILGERYLPQFHVDVPIQQVIDGLVRAPTLGVQLEQLVGETVGAVKSVQRSLQGAITASPGLTLLQEDPLGPVLRFCSGIDAVDIVLDEVYPIEAWRDAIAIAKQSIQVLVDWAWDAAVKPNDEHWRSLLHYLYKLLDLIGDIAEELSGSKWDAANKKALFLTGPGGAGKSHLLGDAVMSILNGKRPALLLPSSVLAASPTGWQAIAERLGRGVAISVDELLGALDAAGQAAETRTLLAIDAINEGPARNWWSEQLSGFLTEAQRYPHVAVVLTCRDVFVDRMVPNAVADVLQALWVEETVDGFVDSTGELARRYLNTRGVSGWLGLHPGPESTNPLFLRSCCDAVLKAGGHELPKGLDGISAMFAFYKTAVNESVVSKLGLMPRLRTVERFVSKFAELVAASEDRYVLFEDAHDLAETIFSSGGLNDKSLLAALESEGLVSVEPGVGGGPDRDYVRFTFERMSDHEIARAILKRHFEKYSLNEVFRPSTPLGDLLHSGDWSMASVVQAIAIQIAEEHGAELGDLVPEANAHGIWGSREDFLDTVRWRAPSAITDRTLRWIKEATSADGLAAFYIEFGPQVGNAFNADWLHERLAGQKMVERDIGWSVTVTRLGFNSGDSIPCVVDWALAAGRQLRDPVRAVLLGTTLAWLLTTSHREVRDKATKALVAVLTGEAGTALTLLQRFRAVDEDYLKERLYAAIYGAALQFSWPKSTYASLAGYVLKEFFGASVPTHILMRDYARGIVEAAVRVGAIADSQATAARPPYASNWSIELVPDIDLAPFVWPIGSGLKDDIVQSCLNDDFEHYTIPHSIQSFGCSPRTDAEVISEDQLAGLWRAHFDSWADKPARQALSGLLGARRELLHADRSNWDRRRELEEQSGAALARLKAEVGELVAENLCVCTRSGDLLVPGNGYRDSKARFNHQWATKWVAKRAHDLGWSAERFHVAEGSFRPTRDRMDHRIERLGKKYQWLALHDLLGRLSDGAQYLEGWSEEPEPYHGPWQVSARNIDPSMLRRSTKDDGWKPWGPTWWMPKRAKLACATPLEALHWLTTEVDVINDESLIDLSDSDGGRWLSLHCDASWNRSGKNRHPSEVTRKSWVHLRCLIVDPSDEQALISCLSKSKAETHPEIPDGVGYSDAFLGEYGWHPSTGGFNEWHDADRRGRELPRVLVPTVEYSSSKGYDYSMDGNCSFLMPGNWLATGLGLRLSSGADLTWATKDGRTAFFDPAVSQNGPSAALVDRAAFLSLLERTGLRAVWVLFGEKELYGPDSGGDAFGGRLHHLGIYRLTSSGWIVDKHRWHLQPRQHQREAFLKCC